MTLMLVEAQGDSMRMGMRNGNTRSSLSKAASIYAHFSRSQGHSLSASSYYDNTHGIFLNFLSYADQVLMFFQQFCLA